MNNKKTINQLAGRLVFSRNNRDIAMPSKPRMIGFKIRQMIEGILRKATTKNSIINLELQLKYRPLRNAQSNMPSGFALKKTSSAMGIGARIWMINIPMINMRKGKVSLWNIVFKVNLSKTILPEDQSIFHRSQYRIPDPDRWTLKILHKNIYPI